MHQIPERTREVKSFPRISIVRRGATWLAITPPEAAPQTLFTLQPFPAQILQWLVGVGHRQWQNRQRCLAALLLISVRTGKWTIRLPQQRCGEHDCSWSPSVEGFPSLAHDHVLGGSFQSHAPVGEGPPDGFVPQPDGLHIVQELPSSIESVKMFLRCQGKLIPISTAEFTYDAHRVAIVEALPRIILV
jgi:hypothetical protein